MPSARCNPGFICPTADGRWIALEGTSPCVDVGLDPADMGYAIHAAQPQIRFRQGLNHHMSDAAYIGAVTELAEGASCAVYAPIGAKWHDLLMSQPDMQVSRGANNPLQITTGLNNWEISSSNSTGRTCLTSAPHGDEEVASREGVREGC
jgi:hypothetical protein